MKPRKTHIRKQLPFVLIVCEGGKTEPQYFAEWRSALRSFMKINIHSDKNGFTPSKTWVEAQQEIEKAFKRNGKGNGYDYAYCVFDKDTHECYKRTLEAIKNTQDFLGTKVFLINSIPSFEVWVLLHFCVTDKPFNNADEVAKEIKKHLNAYEKDGTYNLYKHISQHTDKAIENAEKVIAQLVDTDNPSTYVHTLISHLKNGTST